jgi:DNA-binding NarL/FixJ family response regulator
MSARRLLIADDDTRIVDLLTELMGDAGFTVVGTAHDGAAAVELASTLLPDLVLLDLRMPKKDGLAAAREILRNAPSCRLVMLSAFDDLALRKEALAAGAAAFLTKGVPFADIIAALDPTAGQVEALSAGVG